MHFSVLKLLQILFTGTKYINYDNAALEKKVLYSHDYTNKKHKQFLFILLFIVKDNYKDDKDYHSWFARDFYKRDVWGYYSILSKHAGKLIAILKKW